MGKGLGIRVISTILVIVLLFGALLVTANYTVSADQAGDYTYAVSNGKATITGYTGPGGNITIPATLGGYPIGGILSEAFASHPLTSVTIPNGVTYIGDHAFQRCGNLTLVVIPSSVTIIYLGAFAYCTSLASVTIPNSVTYIWAYAFFGCTSLTSITIPNSVTSINGYAFANCLNLTSITIPNSVTTIADHAFYDCPSLTSIVF